MDPNDYLDRKVRIKDSGSLAQWKAIRYHYDDSKRDYVFTLRSSEEDGIASKTTEVVGSRLELVTYAEQRTPAEKAGYLPMGDVRVHPDESLEWFAFVMLQAGALFQNVPAPGTVGCDEVKHELIRLLTVRGETPDGPVVTAALAYYDAALAWYDD